LGLNGARGRSGFEPFVAARRTGLLRTALLLTRQREEAEDLVQHALMKLYVACPGVESNPDAYLRRMIVNAYIDAGRRRRRLPPVVDAPTTVGPGDAVGERDEMWRALG
jgi:DNA-directed RNA polymerase specialized sigma24 family protein